MIYLITGGTGSLGQELTRLLLASDPDCIVRIFSRDEWKQSEMAKHFPDRRVRFLLGDVRDQERLKRALDGVDVVFHAAAMKQVPACEYNPFEAIKTNVVGAQNLIEAALNARVSKVVALSTDKAVNPSNLYGATKLCSDKLFVWANAYVGPQQTRFGVVRYGNVIGSRGSVVPLFREQARSGSLTLTDERMTRFWITLTAAAEFVAACTERMHGGEIFVPKLPSMRIVDLAEVIAPGIPHEVIGIRAGEKLHEALITEVESRTTWEFDDHYVIRPPDPIPWQLPPVTGGHLVADEFRYTSDQTDEILSHEDLRRLLSASTDDV